MNGTKIHNEYFLFKKKIIQIIFDELWCSASYSITTFYVQGNRSHPGRWYYDFLKAKTFMVMPFFGGDEKWMPRAYTMSVACERSLF